MGVPNVERWRDGDQELGYGPWHHDYTCPECGADIEEYEQEECSECGEELLWEFDPPEEF